MHKSPINATELKWLQCDQCSFRSKRKYNLLRHCKTKHTTDKIETETTNEYISLQEEIKYECVACNYQTNVKCNFDRHQYNYHTDLAEIKLETCDHCSYKSKCRRHLISHLKSKHLIDTDKQIKTEIEGNFIRDCKNDPLRLGDDVQATYFECTDCEFKTSSRLSFRRHQNKQHGHLDKVIWLKCDHCDYRTKYRSHLNRHCKSKHQTVPQINHEGQCNLPGHLQFECTECRFKTFSRLSLCRHKNQHHNNLNKEIWLKCDHCNFKSKFRRNLKRHCETQHTNKKENNSKPREIVVCYKCDECSFTTKKRSNLNKHKEAKHTPVEDIKWLQCPQCPYKAKTKDLYTKHQNYKHRDFFVLYQCHQCTYNTRKKYDLSCHVLKQHTNVLMKCQHCEFHTKGGDNMRSHVRNIQEKSGVWRCDECSYFGPTKRLLLKHRRRKHKTN